MPLVLAAYDPSERLQTAESRAALLSDALATGDPAHLAIALGHIAKAIGMRKISDETGISRATLYASLRADGNPTAETIFKLLAAFGVDLKAEPKTLAA